MYLAQILIWPHYPIWYFVVYLSPQQPEEVGRDCFPKSVKHNYPVQGHRAGLWYWTQATEQVSHCLLITGWFFFRYQHFFFFFFFTVDSHMLQDVLSSQISGYSGCSSQRKKKIFNTKATVRIKGFSWKTRATLYNIWSVKHRVKWDTIKKDTNSKNTWSSLPFLQHLHYLAEEELGKLNTQLLLTF